MQQFVEMQRNVSCCRIV